jgi:signal transduction histidine kinase
VAGDPVAQSYLARCTSSGRRMLDLVDDLLAYARVGGKLKKRTVALNEVLPHVLEDLGPATDGAAIEWRAADVLADPAQLRVLLQNLLANACAYRAGDRACRISVTARDVQGHTVLQVADNGPGIPADVREEALAPLSRLRSDVPGTGLGLATCVRIAAAHGGRLRLEDTPGGGLTVLVDLPR